ncbi:MAG: hypothetical protein E7466_07595 [Ruminococcaceae bacterium]|nr:hypothetical protein [Oscillospiraceae bacterium]
MAKAGNEIGVGVGNMMNHRFQSTPAKIIAMIGRIIGMVALVGCLMVALVDYYFEVAQGKLIWPCILVALVGLGFLAGMHWIALQIDKKHPSES